MSRWLLPSWLALLFFLGCHVTDGKAGLVKAFQDATAVFDSTGLCLFTSFAWTLADVQPQLQAACEGDWSMEKLALVGERIWNLERQFNNAAGFTAKDDCLPPRLTTDAQAAHRQFIASLGENAIWRDYVSLD